MSIYFLFLGFLLGLQHALEPDHIAGVLAVSNNKAGKSGAFKRGISWGVGHALVISLLGVGVLFFGLNIPNGLNKFFETLVVVLLIALGLRSIVIYFRQRTVEPNVVTHTHPPYGKHLHVNPSFFVGILHGLAGSGAVLIIMISTVQSVFLGLLYLLFFNIGSIFSMGIASLFLQNHIEKISKHAPFYTGVFSIGVGIWLLVGM